MATAFISIGANALIVMTPSGPVSRTMDTRGQSSPLAYILVLSIVLVGTVAILTLGTSALQGTQGQSELQRAEHAMTLFDSRAAMVALGTSSSQRISFGQDSGSFETRPDTGWLSIRHVNYTDPPSGEVEEIYNESLGSFVYTNGDTTIAYQGGGVWRDDGAGQPRMISPPEFHFRDSTLTLPVITVNGQAAGSGGVEAVVESRGQPRNIFPNSTSATPSSNETGGPYNGTDDPYQNPIENGTVFVWVRSQYYSAWADYFEERTTGNVTVWDTNNTVRLNLESLGRAPGDFTPPEPTDPPVEAGGMGDGHPVEEFSLSLESDGSPGLNNAHWSLWSDSGSNELEFQIISEGKCQNGGGYSDNKNIIIRLYYHNESTGAREEWRVSDTVDDLSAVTVDCPTKKEGTLNVDFTDTNTEMTYTDFGPASGGSGNKDHFGDGMSKTSDNPAMIGQHDSLDPNGEVHHNSHTETLNWTANHYLSRLPSNFRLQGGAGPGASNRINESISEGRLEYEEAVGSRYITFLHITETEVEIQID